MNKISRGFAKTFLSSFKILVGMLKGPVDFELFNLEISSISNEVTGKIYKLLHTEVFIKWRCDVSTLGTEFAILFPCLQSSY